jgi:hypothetical protein
MQESLWIARQVLLAQDLVLVVVVVETITPALVLTEV